MGKVRRYITVMERKKARKKLAVLVGVMHKDQEAKDLVNELKLSPKEVTDWVDSFPDRNDEICEQHFWLCEPPSGRFALAVCQRCLGTTKFPNSEDAAKWDTAAEQKKRMDRAERAAKASKKYHSAKRKRAKLSLKL